MRKRIVPHLRSPETGGGLTLEIFAADGEDVIEGRLIDSIGSEWFRIENGVADLLPLSLRRAERHVAFAARHGLVTSADGARERSEAHEHQISFFGRYHSEYEKDVVESPFYRVLDNVTLGRWISRNLRPGSLVVEVGAGSGRQSLPLTRHGVDVIGLDLSEEMLVGARRKIQKDDASGHADFVVASAENVPLASDCADAAIIYGSLHHFADPEKSLEQATKVIKPGGLFYMLEPHDSALRPLFEWAMKVWTLWEEEAADEPLFCARQWQAWLTENGVDPNFKYSTFLPPHLFYIMNQRVGEAVLRLTDASLGGLPGVRQLAGIIIAEGKKRATNSSTHASHLSPEDAAAMRAGVG